MNYLAAKHLLDTVLKPYLPRTQYLVLCDLIFSGEEKDYFCEKVGEYAARIANMPKTYEQDGKGDDAIVYLHYFYGSVDAWITEKDMEGGVDQAFGLVNLEGTGVEGAELGYVSIRELVDAGVSLDLNWEPKPIKEIK